jgi:hypothetical protein
MAIFEMRTYTIRVGMLHDYLAFYHRENYGDTISIVETHGTNAVRPSRLRFAPQHEEN